MGPLLKFSILFVVVVHSSLAGAHPGSGIVALSADVVLTGDAVGNGIWRFERGKEPLRLVSRIHCHWITMGLDGRVYAESLGESGGDWATSIHRFDRNGKNPVAIPSGVQANLATFAVDRLGGIVYQDKSHRILVENSGTVSAFRGSGDPAEGKSSLGDVYSYCWGPRGELYLSSENKVFKIGADGVVRLVVTLTGDVVDTLYAGTGNRSRIWGLAVDDRENVYATLPAEGRVVKVSKSGSQTTVSRTEGHWAAIGVATFGQNLFLLESKTVGNTNSGPRVRVIRSNGRSETFGTVNRYAIEP